MSSEQEKYEYFRSISLENIRCFGEKQTIRFTNPEGEMACWNIILGENGVGKTTVLQVLCEDVPYHYPEVFKKTYGRNSQEKNEIAVAMALKNEKKFIPESISSSSRSDLGIEYYINERYEYPGLLAYGAKRKIGETNLSEKGTNYENILNNRVNSLFDDNAQLINPEEWLLQTDYRSLRSPNKKFKENRDKVYQVLLSLFEGEISDIKIEDEPFRVVFKTDYGWVRLHQLSLGYKTLIAWMVDFAAKMFAFYPKSPNPLKEPAIVLVDEIDLHMHPRFQQKLQNFLLKTFEQTQFIVTAHSPLIVQSSEDANIILLKKVGDQVEVENNPINVENWRVDQILASDLFGYKSKRTQLIEEKSTLMAKVELSKKEQLRLENLNEELGFLPSSEMPELNRAMQIIQEAAKSIEDQNKTHDKD